MSIASKKASGAPSAGSRKPGTQPTVKLGEMLTREGSPWRPLQESGMLVKGQKRARDAKAIFAACERQLLSHLGAVCLWPKKERNVTWRAGDSSFYVLSFNPAPKILPYIQFWSEPDEGGAIFEVSSGAWNPPTETYVDTEKQELLRDHGFEIGGKANNFRKILSIESARDVRAVAREAAAVLCKVLGYDGTFDLDYELNLQTAYLVRHVLNEITPYTLEKLLREWGFVAELKREEAKPPLIEGRTDHGPFGVLFADETKDGSGRFQALKLEAFKKVKNDQGQILANHVNQRFPFVRGRVDADGDLGLETQVFLHGGVTAEHLRVRLELWRWVMAAVVEAET